MEIHHHPSRNAGENLPAGQAGKRFKEYFLEFLMIFLAVTLGFFAENVRESFGNNEKEKHYMQNLIADLKIDTEYLHYFIHYQQLESNMLDSALQIPARRLTNINTQDTFFHYLFLYYSLVPEFSYNKNTISQLKAGGFNVIRNKSVIDSINYLYQEYDLVEFDNRFNETSFWDVAHAAQSIMQLPEPAKNWDDPSVNFIPKERKLFFTNDSREIGRLYNLMGNSTGSFKTCIEHEKEAEKHVTQFISYISEQYHIK